MTSDLEKALLTGFLDKNIISYEHLQPKLLVNDKSQNLKILGSFLTCLRQCEEFWFSVAFVTPSGVACIHNTLDLLEQKGIKGKILVSQYLNFTHPEALRYLLRFSNIETKFIQTQDFHGKSYMFKTGNQYELIMGSSNLTADALCSNSELNLRVRLSGNSKVIDESRLVFDELFSMASPLSNEVIQDYEKVYRDNALLKKEMFHLGEPKQFEPNSMQIEALERLNGLRKIGVDKALVISATGTGKTVLAALDVRASRPKRMLFVVHRWAIARAAMNTFANVMGSTATVALYDGSIDSGSADFLFTTVQTINNDRHLQRFEKRSFDYIVIDETHRAGARTYRRVLEYFAPKFLLGMTATPERSDGFDIFSLFDYNIGYEIRLQRAMEEGLLSPFHYFGITDISVDGHEIDDRSDFNSLVSQERVDRIIETAVKHGCDNGDVRGLIFCSRVDESKELSKLFNLRGYSTVHLSGTTSEDDRLDAISKLEDDGPDKLDYIFSVDVFNEGVDIPKVNQIIMLRPTQSAIIFVQQLGRGLRHATGKDYVTVIDFIGNYENNYMIPMALYGDSSYNKDTLRKLITSGGALIPGTSTVNFDRIAEQKIFDSINATNLNKRKDLSMDYLSLKARLGKTPMMMDFVTSDSRNPFSFVEYAKSYLNFVNLIDEQVELHLPSAESALLEYLSRYINDGKRIEESVLLKFILKHNIQPIDAFNVYLQKTIGSSFAASDIGSILRNVNLNFITERSSGKSVPVGDLYGYDIVKFDQQYIKIGDTLARALDHGIFRTFLEDSIDFSLTVFKRGYEQANYLNGFQRYKKYSRRDVFRILGWVQNPNPQNVGGYVVSSDMSNCPIFVNYQKTDDIPDTVKYEDKFLSPSVFTYMSKNRRTLQSPDVVAIKNQQGNGIRLPLFVKKSNDEGLEFYFLGDLYVIEKSFLQETMSVNSDRNVSVVRMDFELDQKVEQNLYEYLVG